MVADENDIEQPTGQYVLGGNFGTGNLVWDTSPDESGYCGFSINRDYLSANSRYGHLMADANEYAQVLKTSKLVNVTSYSASALQITQSLLDIAATYTVQAVTGAKNTDSDWDAMIEQMNTAGYQSNIAEIKEVARSLGLLN